MSTCSSLNMNDRIHVAYGSIISSSLSIIGTICTIILIKIRIRKSLINDPQRKQLINKSINSSDNGSISTSNSLNNNSNNSNSSNNRTCGFSYFNDQNSNSSNNSNNSLIDSLNSNKKFYYTSNNNNSNYKISTSANNQKTKVSHFIINLSIADLLASIFILISNVMMIHFSEKYVETPFSSDSYSFINMMSICTLSNGFVSFSYISTFFWTFSIFIYIYQQFSLTSIGSNSSRNNKVIKILFYIVNWVIPFILGGIIVSGSRIQDKFTDSSSSNISSGDSGYSKENTLPWCSIDGNTELASFYLPLILSMIFTLFYTVLIKKRFSNGGCNLGGSSTSTLIKLQNKIIGRLSIFCLVFWMCWSLKLISFFITYFTNNISKAHECKQLLWLEVLSATLFPLQGFLNFLSFAIFKKIKEYLNSKFNSISNLFKSLFNSKNNNINNNNNNDSINNNHKKNSDNNSASNLFYTNKSNSTNNNNNNNFYFTFSTFDFNNDNLKGKK